MGSLSRTEHSLPELDAFGEDFTAFHGRFASLFARSEPRHKSAQYLRSLMGPVERRNCWQMAEAIGDERPDSAQRLLYHARWSACGARDRLADFIVEQFGDPEGIGVLDDTGFVKKGTESVGVQRQYSGTAGKIENCQVGVFLGYTSPRGHVLLDRALYLPETWCSDAARRCRAHVPSKVQFRTKPELGLWMLRRAWRRGVPMSWVTGDEVYGDDPRVRAGIETAGRLYVLAVASSTPVWTTRPEVIPPAPSSRTRAGRPRTRARLAPDAPPAQAVAQVVAGWPEDRWHRFATQQGEKGPILYDWACERVIESRARLPASDLWLMARRSLADSTEIAYYLSNAGAGTTLPMLAWVASRRYTIEQCFEEAKDDVGLDHYEVRTWPSWHRYVTLTMMALAWLASVRAKLADPSSELARRTHVADTESALAEPVTTAEKKTRSRRATGAARSAGSLVGPGSPPAHDAGAALAGAFARAGVGVDLPAKAPSSQGANQPLPPSPLQAEGSPARARIVGAAVVLTAEREDRRGGGGETGGGLTLPRALTKPSRRLSSRAGAARRAPPPRSSEPPWTARRAGAPA